MTSTRARSESPLVMQDPDVLAESMTNFVFAGLDDELQSSKLAEEGLILSPEQVLTIKALIDDYKKLVECRNAELEKVQSEKKMAEALSSQLQMYITTQNTENSLLHQALTQQGHTNSQLYVALQENYIQLSAAHFVCLSQNVENISLRKRLTEVENMNKRLSAQCSNRLINPSSFYGNRHHVNDDLNQRAVSAPLLTQP